MTLLSEKKLSEIGRLLEPEFKKENGALLHALVQPIISSKELGEVRLQLLPLKGLQLDVLKIPEPALYGFEPSQIGTIVGTIMDACIPQLHMILPDDQMVKKIGLVKHSGILGDREGYPDFKLDSGRRIELKLLYVDPVGVAMKKPPTPREPSARLTQKVTYKNVDPENDILLVLAYQLQKQEGTKNIYVPTIIDYEVFPVIECIIARDIRLAMAGGKWFGKFETPTVLSKIGADKRNKGQKINYSSYGRKESEGHDLNEDTNFGKLKRIPYAALQKYLSKNGATFTKIADEPSE